MATKVAGELYKVVTGQLFEIGRQPGRKVDIRLTQKH